MRLFIMLVALVIFGAVDAKAQTVKTWHWHFALLTDGSDGFVDTGYMDFSKELEQDIAVPLPTQMVKENWSCVRRSIQQDYSSTGRGGFHCSNGTLEFWQQVSCDDGKYNILYLHYHNVNYPYGSMVALESSIEGECVVSPKIK